MERISENPVKAWKEKIDWFQNSLQQREMDRIDGEPMEFEWKKFPGFTTVQILAEIQNMMTEIKCEPEQFQGRIVFMSMYNDTVWREKGNKELCIANSINVADYARRFAPGQWSFLGPGSETKWYESHTYKPNACVSRIQCLRKRRFEEQRKRKRCPYISMAATNRPNGVRTSIFVNQLSIYVAVTDMCEELAWEISKCSEGTERPEAPNDSETMVMPTELTTTNQTPPTDERVHGDLLRDYVQTFANLSVHLKWPNCAPMQVSRIQ